MLDSYESYFREENGYALLWLEPWDGSGSLDLRVLDPYFIEVCRRVRLRERGSSIIAVTAGSRAPRIAAKAANGDVGDFWTPVNRESGKALSLSPATLRYDRLVKLIYEKDFRHPPAMKVDSSKQGRWRLVARGVAGGQGKTEGYHERSDVVFRPRTVRALFRKEQRDELARVAEAQMDEIREVNEALRFGVATAASGGKAADKLTRADRIHADPYSRLLDTVADARFFTALEERFLAADEAEAATCRESFARTLIDAAERLLDEAIDAVPCTSIHRHRARARGVSAFWGRLRGARSVFRDQPKIFDRKEALHASR